MDDTATAAGANDKPVYVPDDMYNALRRMIDDMEQACEKLLRAREEREKQEQALQV